MLKKEEKMPGIRYMSVLLLCLFVAAGNAYPFNGQAPKAGAAQAVPGRLVVKFRSESRPRKLSLSQGVMTTGVTGIDALNRTYRVANMAPFIRPRPAGQSSAGFENVFVLTVGNEIDLAQMQMDYEKLPGVEYAEPDYWVELYEAPNDSLYPRQWNLSNTGQEHFHVLRKDGSNNDQLILTSGIPDADIDADEVFQNPPDNTSTVIVAIIDTGADMKHPDLMANIWVNPGEIAANGIDDDNNGYIDDINGWDFAGDGDIGQGGDNDPTDHDGHGTHCAGIVAAVTNNLSGVAGVAPGAKIMPLKFDPWPLTTIIAAAILYAADNGADVVNMSFGLPFRSHLIDEALDYASNKGVVLCAASGNDFAEKINFPAGSPSVIAVGASNDSDHVTSFSTYGENIEVVAPGLDILSLRAKGTDMYAEAYPREPRVHIIDSMYYLSDGTSMACPHVVGVAAYLRAVSPGLTPDAVRQIIGQTADDYLDPYGVGWNLPGWDKYSGYGRVNLAKALAAAPALRARIESPAPNQVIGGPIDIIGLADGADFTEYTVEYGDGDDPLSWTTLDISNSPVSGGLLASWNTAGLSGRFTIRLRVGTTNVSMVSISLANGTVAEITAPTEGETISNSVAVSGNAYCPDFSHFVLEYGLGVSPAIWDTITVQTVPAFGTTLAGWFVEDITAGDYTLRISVYSRAGLAASDSVLLHIESIFSTNRAWKAKLDGITTIVPNYGDFDADGTNEILVGYSDGIKVYSADGSPKMIGAVSFPSNDFATPIAVGRLDHDNFDDFVALGYDPPIVYGYPSGSASFRNYLGILPGISSNLLTEREIPKIFLKDVNGDGLDEIHIVIYNGSLSKAFLLNADGSLRFSLNYCSSYLPVDMDGDGMDELYVCNDGNGLLKQLSVINGSPTDSLLIQMNGSSFTCMDITAYDIDGDNKPELLVYGYFDDFGYQLYAFDEGLQLKSGWPHDMGIGTFVVPTTPIFGDINNDGSPEYFCTYFDFSSSYILAWNLDGTSFVPGSIGGFFATVPQPSILNMLMLADMNNDGDPELVAAAINDVFFTYNVQRIYAWDKDARMLPGFPLIAEMGVSTYLRYSPVIGDIDKDGNVDFIATTADSGVVFVNFPNVPYDSCHSTAPFWRYNRRMNGVGHGSDSCHSTDVPELEPSLPNGFALGQNAPNPFNSATMIEYAVPSRSHVTISVYDILGRKVRDIVNEPKSSGKYSACWDGRDSGGKEVASGVYFYRIKAGDFAQSRKMVLLK
jgi:Subtilase family/FlgD Ig-like domain/FG-GAP-like repeat